MLARAQLLTMRDIRNNNIPSLSSPTPKVKSSEQVYKNHHLVDAIRKCARECWNEMRCHYLLLWVG